ncbi:MAG: SUF system NifU family Fe-S cluster assembly protein [Actinomycetota bacterium]|nr:SUF system NifU family Fe-S cluster assembly protein [Actinomycetota bacterium]
MELDSLYQEIILDHYKHPRGKGLLELPQGSAHHVNPTCGDEITVQVSTNAEGGLEIGYEGQGCSISQASASVLTELLTGSSVDQSQTVREAFIELMHAQGQGEPDEDVLGDAVAFAGVAKFPARVKCALLAWMALQDAEIKAGMLSKGDGS